MFLNTWSSTALSQANPVARQEIDVHSRRLDQLKQAEMVHALPTSAKMAFEHLDPRKSVDFK